MDCFQSREIFFQVKEIFVQFARMGLYYRLSTETHHVSVQSESFHSEVRE